MKKLRGVSKKILVWLTVVVIFCTLAPAAVFAGEETNSALNGDLQLGESVHLSISIMQPSAQYSFTPEESGNYTIVVSNPNAMSFFVSYQAQGSEVTKRLELYQGADNTRIGSVYLEGGIPCSFVFSDQETYELPINCEVLIKKTEMATVRFVTNREGTSFSENFTEPTSQTEDSYEIGRCIYESYHEPKIRNPEEWVFIGWTSNPNGSVPENPVYVSEGLVLYAVWVKAVTLTFDANGGYFGDDLNQSISTKTVGTGTMAYLYPNDPINWPDGSKTFEGWAQTKNGGARYSEFDSVELTENKTLYAVWKDRQSGVGSATLTFDANGGCFGGNPDQVTSTKTVIAGTTVDLHPENPISWPDGSKTFLGWAKMKDGEVQYSESDEIVLTENKTLYAVWKNKKLLELGETVHLDRSKEVSDRYFFIPQESGKYVVVFSNTMGMPYGYYCLNPYDEDSKDLYSDWSDDHTAKSFIELEAGRTCYFLFSFDSMGYESCSYDVHIEKAVITPVTFITNQEGSTLYDSSDNASQRITTEYEVGRKIETFAPTPIYQKPEELTFIGWSTDPDGDKPEEELCAKEGLVLYAVWAKTVTLTFDANGGCFGGDPEQKTSNKTGGAGTTFYLYNHPSWPDGTKRFKGWSEEKDGEAQYSASDEIVLTENKTLYAVWKEKTVVPVGNGEAFEIDDEFGESTYYKFVPAETGRYAVSFEASNECDPRVGVGLSLSADFDNDFFSRGSGSRSLEFLLPELQANQEYYFIFIDDSLGSIKGAGKIRQVEVAPVKFHANHNDSYIEVWDDENWMEMRKPDYTDIFIVGSTIDAFGGGTYTPMNEKGMEFLGWALDANASAPEDITVIVRPDGNPMDVYAVWRKGSSSSDPIPKNIIATKETSNVLAKKTTKITVRSKTVEYNGKAQTIPKAKVKGSKGKITYTYYVDKACKKKTTKKNSGAKKKGAPPKYAGIYYVKVAVKADRKYKAATRTVTLTVRPKIANYGFRSLNGSRYLCLQISGMKNVSDYSLCLTKGNKTIRKTNMKNFRKNPYKPALKPGVTSDFKPGVKYGVSITFKMKHGGKIKIKLKQRSITR